MTKQTQPTIGSILAQAIRARFPPPKCFVCEKEFEDGDRYVEFRMRVFGETTEARTASEWGKTVDRKALVHLACLRKCSLETLLVMVGIR